MKIDDNKNEIDAVKLFRKGFDEEGNVLEQMFVSELNEARKNGEDLCPCPEACYRHGDCVECVAIHRAHGDHLPYCFHNILNRKIASLLELSESKIQK